MTKISSDDINSRKRLQKDQKVPLIPPARIRTLSNQQQQQTNKQNKQPFSEIPAAVNEQLNMKPREPSNPNLGDEMWSSVEDLFWDHMKEVQNKWSTLELNYDIWAKLIYFEQNRRLAKAYVSAPVLTIDGSANGLDGFRIGLSGIDNKYRSLSSTRCLKSIGQGVKLKIDNQGNILIRKVANGNNSRQQTQHQQQQQQQQQQQVPNLRQCSIWVKDWPGSVNTNQDQQANNSKQPESFLNENCMIRELEKSDVSYKLFDMRKFRLQLEKKRLKNDPNFIDWTQCVSIISFVRNNNSQLDSQTKSPSGVLLDDPCWIMLINIIAIDMLKSSIICDRSSMRQKMGSSNMIQQHALLVSSNSYNHDHRNDNQQMTNNNNDKNRSFSTIESSSKPTGSSSSVSVLSPISKSMAQTSAKPQSFSSNTTNSSNNSSNFSNSQSSHNNNFSNSMPLDSIIQDEEEEENNELDEENYLMLATNERIKKLRTANNRLRMSPSKSRSYYRKYQSTQQLSSLSNGNNTIYTTFNSKFINSNRSTKNKHTHPSFIGNIQDSNSSNSDHYNYNSVSRSTSSGNYWQPNNQSNNQPFYQVDSSKHRLQLQRNSMYRDDARLVPGQGFLTTPFEPKSISMSTFDLSLKPLDLRSSIKMNYDKVDECEDDLFFGHNNQNDNDNNKSRKSSTLFQEGQAHHFNETIPFKTHSRRAIISSLTSNAKPLVQEETTESKQQSCASPNCFCCAVEELKHTNHHHLECQSNQNKQLLDSKCTSMISGNNNQDVHDQPRRTSKPSSFDSSSSSSGCADNDYLISHSSFSMSSSTGSNERDLFSQPASSSGIACSGNTSDEYDDGGRAAKHKAAKTSLSSNKHENNGRRSLSPKNVSVDDLTTKNKVGGLKKSNGDLINNKFQPKRGFRNKSLGINGGYCCDSGLIETNHDNNCAKEFDCDCPSIEIADCNSCCDCFVDSAPLKLAKSLSRNALYEDESIYSKLPFPADISTKFTTNESTKTNYKTHKSDGSIARVSSTTNLNNININGDERNSNDISTIPDANKSTKASKESNGGAGGGSWLEKRRYSKILPKFIFSSSSNNNRQVRNPDKSTQRKSNTLDRVEKFTLFKSTNDL